MSDYSELKRLAEALKRAIEQAEHKPGEWAGTAQSMGGICCPGVPFQIGKPWAKEEPWASFSYKRDSWLAVAAVNALPRLLGLIADNERLTKAVGLQVIRRFVGDDDQKNIDELVAAGIQVDKELIVQLKAENERLAAACERAEQIIIVECKAASLAKVRANLLEANRDQLRAEVAGLKTGYEAYEQINAGLKAEVEALRKSAPSKEVVWCSCGDGHAANSYGAGFMDANGGVCANCDAAVGSGRSNSRGSEQGQTPTETPVPERSACRSENP